MKFNFSSWTALVDNRSYDYSTLRRSCNSVDVELSVPFTDSHLLAEVSCSLFRWRAKPDAWELTTDGPLEIEPLFPYCEWVSCPECGEDVINDEVEAHIEAQHDGEPQRFPLYGKTRDEYESR